MKDHMLVQVGIVKTKSVDFDNYQILAFVIIRSILCGEWWEGWSSDLLINLLLYLIYYFQTFYLFPYFLILFYVSSYMFFTPALADGRSLESEWQ